MRRFIYPLLLTALLLAPSVRADQEKKRVQAPRDDARWKVTELGYMEIQDAFVEKDDGYYAFVVYPRAYATKRGKAPKGFPDCAECVGNRVIRVTLRYKDDAGFL